jgi:hypothetical protein
MFLQWGLFFDVTTTTHGEGAAKNCHLMRESVTHQQICRICGWQFFGGRRCDRWKTGKLKN